MRNERFGWKAKFEDGTEFLQYPNAVLDDYEVENSSHPIFDNSKAVSEFSLSDGKDCFVVDLITGNIMINGKSVSLYSADGKSLVDPGNVYRLIFFKRVTRTLNISGYGKEFVSMDYFLGWQFTRDNVNTKRILEILPDGTVRLRSDTFDVPEKLYDIIFEE